MRKLIPRGSPKRAKSHLNKHLKNDQQIKKKKTETHPPTRQAKNGKCVSERKRTRATSNASKGKQRRARKATPTMANNVEQDKQRQHWQTTTSKTSKASNGKKRHARQATPAANNTEQSPPNSQHHLKNCSKIFPTCYKNLEKMIPKYFQNY